jgi:integrase
MIETETAIKQWVRYIRRTQAENTAQTYNRVIHHFLPFAPLDYEQLNWQHIEEWMDYFLQDHGCSKNTVDTYYTAIKSFCRWMDERYDIPNPSFRVRFLNHRQKRRWKQRIITQAEYEQITAVARGLLLDAIQWLAHTGLRSFEFRAMRWSHLADNRQNMTVIGKGDNERTVPLDNPVCQEIIRRHINTTEPPFVMEFADCKLRLLRCLNHLADQTRIPRFGPHALRHYYCTRMVEKGIPLKVVSEILGHASTRITERIYTHLTKQSVMGWSHRLCEEDRG